MLRLKSLLIGYHAAAPILRQIDARLGPDRLVALIGRNGSGKSTLIRTMSRLLPPLAGSVEGPDAAIVLTAMPDLRHTTARQMVAYGRLPYTGFWGRLHDADLSAADHAIDLIGINNLSSRLFCDLSDGEKQKVMIARALTQDTPILLLDEPSAFLDYPSRIQLFELLLHLAHHERKSILISTHEVDLAQRYADELWMISDGALQTGISPDRS